MRKFEISGMSCAACSARVEKAVSQLDKIEKCQVNLLTNSMIVEGDATDDEIIGAVTRAGYGARSKDIGRKSLKGTGASSTFSGVGDVLGDDVIEKEAKALKLRLEASLIFWAVLMYFSMGHMMWGWPVPSWISNNHVAMGILELILSSIIMVINQKFFVNGFKGLFKGAPNMDTLVALGASASFGYSVFMLFFMTDAVLKGNHELVMHYMDEFYFESAGTILTLITVGKMLEARSKGKTKDALRSLVKLTPKMATVLRKSADGIIEETTIPVEDVLIDDIFVIKPGESIPVDGMIEEGESAVNESALTGESIPVDKYTGDKVSAGTINTSGFLKCRATRVGEDTTISQIIRMVMDASATKAPIAKIADKVSGVFVPTVIAIASVTFLGWILAGMDFGFSLARAISVLVISCPCALGLATPVAIMVGNGVGARNGILYKSAATLEEIAKVSTVVLDKTGTITNGTPVVTNIISEDEETLLKYAKSLEIKSEHPLSKAVINYSAGQNATMLEVTDFEAVSGGGLCGRIDGKMYYGGNEKYISRYQNIDESQKLVIEKFSLEGKTPLIFASEEKILGIIAVADTIKDDSIEAIIRLKELGINTVMLTGDNENTASYIAKMVGIDEVVANVLPDEKNAVIKSLQENGKVAMVGDGINDAISLAGADVGIAIGSGTDVAIDAADLVLVNSRLMDVPGSIMLGRATLRNIKQNLFWAFIYNVIGIPLAAGVWYPLSGILLNPMFGAAAMSLSSFCVVTNALRLNFVKLSRSKKIEATDSGVSENTVKVKDSTVIENEINDNSVKENETMEKKLIIEGMMCGHCEARVKKVLEELDGVKEAKVSHEHGTAVVSMTEEISNDVLIKTVTDQGYEVTDIM